MPLHRHHPLQLSTIGKLKAVTLHQQFASTFGTKTEEEEEEKMADLRDEYGNPIQLSDEHGNPVQLKDEYGNPMQLTGVAITHTDVTTVDSASPGGFVGGGGCLGDTNVMSGPGTGVVSGQGLHLPGEGITYTNQPEHGFGSSSSSSSEDDGQGGRTWKKKGLKQKIKEKLTGGKTKDELEQTVGDGTVSTTATHHDQHEKKTMMEKIKEKLPGHHNQY